MNADNAHHAWYVDIVKSSRKHLKMKNLRASKIRHNSIHSLRLPQVLLLKVYHRLHITHTAYICHCDNGIQRH